MNLENLMDLTTEEAKNKVVEELEKMVLVKKKLTTD